MMLDVLNKHAKVQDRVMLSSRREKTETREKENSEDKEGS